MPEPRRRKPSPEVARARARLAGLTSRRASPEAISRARADLTEARGRAAVRAALGRLLELPDAERAQLAGLLLAGGGDHAA